MNEKRRLQLLNEHHAALENCRQCANMIAPVVHGGSVVSRIYLLGQAPGPHEGKYGRPFAWTAGKTMFNQWFLKHLGVDEETFRSRVYMAAVARCFPGKAKGGGDRRPDAEEIEMCKAHIEREVYILQPALVIPVGTLAIEQVLQEKKPLVDVIGKLHKATFHKKEVDVIALPHPSGASTWHRMQPGITLLHAALRLLGEHVEWKRVFG